MLAAAGNANLVAELPLGNAPRTIGQLFERLGEPTSEEIGRRYRRQEDEKDREGHVASEVVEE